MSLLREGVREHYSRLIESAGVLVTYYRGEDCVEVYAVPGETVFEQVERDGSVVEVRSRDWTVLQSALDFGAGHTEPVVKDSIQYTEDEEATVYEVLRDAGQKHFREADAFGGAFRIHTKVKAG